MSHTQQIRYAVDVTLDDVEATFTFLQDQLIGRHWKVGTEEYRTNSALRGAVSSYVGSLRYALGEDAIAHAAGDEVRELGRVQAVRAEWNDLVAIAEHWKDVDGFDAARWAKAAYIDAEHEASVRAYTDRQEAAASKAGEFVSEYRIPAPRSGGAAGGEFVVVRDPENPHQWAVFEGSVQGRHWDGEQWQHAAFTGASPYRYSCEKALDTARQHAAGGTADAKEN